MFRDCCSRTSHREKNGVTRTSTMYSAVTAADYPLISATTLIITIMVLIVTFLLDIIYGFIDPRVKAAQFDS